MTTLTKKLIIVLAVLGFFSSSVWAAERSAVGTFLVEFTATDDQGLPYVDSFVADVFDINLLAQVRRIVAGELESHVAVFKIATGPGGVLASNKNYHTAAQRLWTWHVAELVELVDIADKRLPASEPQHASSPSEIDANPGEWITLNGSSYAPITARSTMEFGRDFTDGRLVNVSNRGVTGIGDRVLITGFAIHGAEPRRVLIRGRGPSLAPFELEDVLSDPLIRVYSDRAQIGGNDDWKKDQSMAPFLDIPEYVADLDDMEPAVVMTLPPGTYTVHLASKGEEEGLGLVEVFDVNGP